jgi:hypothetical protein
MKNSSNTFSGKAFSPTYILIKEVKTKPPLEGQAQGYRLSQEKKLMGK